MLATMPIMLPVPFVHTETLPMPLAIMLGGARPLQARRLRRSGARSRFDARW
jgi:hypothetical protein